jgi:hypothetical protein
VSVVHVPDSAWAKEATKWEAQGSTMGPGLRPYVKRDWPSWVYRAGQLPKGGIDIVDSQAIDEHQYDGFRANGYRLEPLEAIDAFKAQQLEFAKLAAERTWETKHRLSPHAVEEVQAAEEAAGAQHLPTMPETPHGLRGVRVFSTAPLEPETSTIVDSHADTIARLEARLAEMEAKQAAPKRRGRPKKQKPDTVES